MIVGNVCSTITVDEKSKILEVLTPGRFLWKTKELQTFRQQVTSTVYVFRTLNHSNNLSMQKYV